MVKEPALRASTPVAVPPLPQHTSVATWQDPQDSGLRKNTVEPGLRVRAQFDGASQKRTFTICQGYPWTAARKQWVSCWLSLHDTISRGPERELARSINVH